MMGLDFFKKVTEYQMEYGRSGVTVANGFQTNATLLDDEWAEHLAKYKFLVGVSVDGPAEVHDRFRINNDGKGTHVDVIEMQRKVMAGSRVSPGKVGRNDPCPCGSGKKYKKCCG